MLRKTTRLILYTSIILFWIAMMAILLIREGYFQRDPGVFSNERWEKPTDWWVGIYTTEDKKVGFIQLQTQPERFSPYGPAFKMNLFSKIDTVLFSFPVGLTIQGNAWFSQKQGLENFQISLYSNETRITVAGEYDGRKIHGTIKSGDDEVPFNLPIGKNVLLSGGPALPMLDTPVLEPGSSITMDVLDPLSMSVQKAVITSHAKEQIESMGEMKDTYRLTITLLGLTTTVWVTPDHEIIQATTPFGLKLKRVTPQEAMGATERGDLIANTAIKPSGKKPFRDAKKMVVKIEGVSDELPLPTTLYQTKLAEGYFIEPPTKVVSKPLTERMLLNIPHDTLTGDPLIQVDHPKIKDLAQQLAGNEKDPFEKVKKVFDWIQNNIQKKITLNIPSALSVLETRQGDCNEIAVLATALLRAMGIPTRIAIGLVWSDELDAFGYHAWIEVFTGEWIPVDPTLNQLIADATHIVLIHGNIDQWIRLTSFVNRISIEVVHIE